MSNDREHSLETQLLTRDSSSSDDSGKLDGSVAYLLSPGAEQHFVCSAVEISPLKIQNRPAELYQSVKTHIEDHIQKNRLPYRVKFSINGDFVNIDLRLKDILMKQNLYDRIVKSLISKIVADSNGNLAYSVHVWTIPSPLSTD